MKTFGYLIFTVLATAVVAAPLHADDNKRTSSDEEPRGSLSMDGMQESQQLVTRSLEIYREMTKAGRVPSSVLKNAKCVAIFPDVVTAAVGVGGTSGEGIAMCRNASDKKWSNPAFMDIAGGSIGIQAGVKSADIVLFMSGDRAQNALREGSFRVAGDLSAVAGTFDETFVAPPNGVVAYANSGGVFAGASVVGVNISHDEDNQKAIYGSYKKDNVFDNKVPRSIEQRVEQLREALPS